MQLEKQEYLADVALKGEKLRQEKLEHLAYKFERKTLLREGYLNKMIAVLSDPRYGSNLQQLGASVKKHEAISADILVRQNRLRDLQAMSSELQRERYCRVEEIIDKEKAIIERWEQVLELLGGHRDKLERHCTNITIQREIGTKSIKKVSKQSKTVDVGAYIQQVQSENHNLKRKFDQQYYLNQQYNTKFTKLKTTSMILQKKVSNLQDTVGQIGSELFNSQVDGATVDTSGDDSDSYTFANESEDSYTFANSDSEDSVEKSTFVQNPLQTVLFKKAQIQETQPHPQLQTSVTCSVGCNKNCGAAVISWTKSDLENIREIFHGIKSVQLKNKILMHL